MKRAALWPLIALAAFSCTDAGAVGRLPPKRVAAVSGAGAAGQPGPACSQPPCSVLPCNPADWWCPLCASDDDCADDEREKLCNPTTTFCVECRTDADCPASNPRCDDGDCGQCAEDSDCPDDMQCHDGQCEPD